MPIRPLAFACMLVVPAAAQIPTDTVVTFESTQLLEPYYKLVDVLGRGATTLADQNAFMAVTSVSVDPSTNSQFFWIGAASSLPGTYRSQVVPLASFGQSVWGPWSQAAALRVAVGDSRIVTLEGNGAIEARPKDPLLGGAVINLSRPGGVDVAIAGELLYTLAGGTVFEDDLSNGATRTVGSYPGATALAVAPDGQELLLGMQTGDLQRVAVATGGVTATTSTGLGALTVVGLTRFATAVYTDGIELWSELSPAGPIYVSPTTILDFSVAIATGPSVLPFGDGCGAGASADWNVLELPGLGNATFTLGLVGAPSQTPCVLALGASRSLWTAANVPLPFDLQAIGAPGCELLVDPAVALLLTSSLSGTVGQTVPIPNTPALAGAEFVAQWFVPDAAVGPLGLAASEGVAFVVY